MVRPHIGVLSACPELLEELTLDKLRLSSDGVPERWELGTLPFESLAGRARRGRVRDLAFVEEVRAHEDSLLECAPAWPRSTGDALRRSPATAPRR